ncbi:MAG: aspartate aminotransferase family protein [Deferribacterota bacterium]|nr:aspartate aminotransferase family protein [Deferribacterota bacterium]
MSNNMEIFEKWESNVRAYCRSMPTVFVSASNAKLVDEMGTSYIDFFAGAGVLNFGHNNNLLKEEIINFLKSDGIAHSLDLYTKHKREFIKKFVNTILEPRKMNYKIQFTGPTGTNAVEAAIKLAKKVTSRNLVVSFSHGFHGMTLGSLGCTGNKHYRQFPGSESLSTLKLPYCYETNIKKIDLEHHIKTLEDLKEMFNDPASGVLPPAAFLIETIQAEGGVRVAGTKWLQSVRELAREINALFIIDDIQVGCGRTGNYFSFENLDLDPDIITLAKGIGGYGTPLAVTLNKPEYDKYWQPGEHTGTFRGQGISFVAGKKALDYFDNDEFTNKVREKGDYMYSYLSDLIKDYKNIDLRGKGMIYGIDTGDGNISKDIIKECFNNGLVISGCGSAGEVIKFIPPLTIPKDELKKGLNIFEKSFRKIMRAK